MMFGPKVRFCVTFKTNEKSFNIYKRHYIHDFMVPLSKQNFEGSLGIELPSINCYLVTQTDKVIMYDSDTFQQVFEFEVNLQEETTREPNQVISL